MTDKHENQEFNPAEDFEPEFVDPPEEDMIETDEMDSVEDEDDSLSDKENTLQKAKQSDDKFKKYAIWGGAAFLGLGALGIASVLLFTPQGGQQVPASAINQVNQQQRMAAQAPHAQSPATLDDQARQGLVAQDTKALEELKRQAQQAKQQSNSVQPVIPMPHKTEQQETAKADQEHQDETDAGSYLEPAQQDKSVKVEGAAALALSAKAFGSINVHIDEAKSEILSQLSSMRSSLEQQNAKLDTIMRDLRKTKQMVKANIFRSVKKVARASKTIKHAKPEHAKSSRGEKPVSSVWRVQGIELGAAVLKNVKTGKIAVVMPGDVISGLGMIKKIDPQRGIVIGARQVAESDSQV